MARMRMAIDAVVAGVMIAAGVFLVAKSLAGAERMPRLAVLAAAGLAGLGGFWLWLGFARGNGELS